MNAAAVGPAVQAAAGAIDAQPSRLSAADSAYADARRESDRLRALIQSGRNNPEDVAAYQSADTALSSATSEREAALTAFFAAATANLTAEQRTALERIRANRSWILSPEFLVIERSQQEWVALRDALASERIAAKLGVELEPEVVAALATWRSNASVAAAKANLDGNLASVTAAWNSATTGE